MGVDYLTSNRSVVLRHRCVINLECLTEALGYGNIRGSSLKTFQQRREAANATVHSRFIAQAVIVKAMAHPSRL